MSKIMEKWGVRSTSAYQHLTGQTLEKCVLIKMKQPVKSQMQRESSVSSAEKWPKITQEPRLHWKNKADKNPAFSVAEL